MVLSGMSGSIGAFYLRVGKVFQAHFESGGTFVDSIRAHMAPIFATCSGAQGHRRAQEKPNRRTASEAEGSKSRKRQSERGGVKEGAGCVCHPVSIYLLLCLLVGIRGPQRAKSGSLGVFLLSLVVTPVIAFIALLL